MATLLLVLANVNSAKFFFHKLATSTLNTDKTDTNSVKLLL